MTRRRRKIPQPPIDPASHPTGARSVLWSTLLVAVGVCMVVLGPWRIHDVFGDGAQLLTEWQLTEAVTVGGPKPLPKQEPRPVTPQTASTPADSAEPVPLDNAPNVQNGDDYCKT